MAWTKTGWFDLVGASGVGNGKELAAAGASSGSIMLDGTNDYITMATQVYYAASTAASTLTVEWLGWNHSGTSLVDTTAFHSVEISGTNSASVKQTYQINVSGLDGVKVQATNNEDTDGASVHISAMFGYI